MSTAAPAAGAAGDQRPAGYPYGWALGVFAMIVAIYAVTIAPTTQFWDASEYIAAAKALGIPHAPGNPLFVLVAHVWGMLPLVGHYALRINLLAAVTSALAAAFLFLVAERFLRSTIEARWARYAAAFSGVLVGATSFTVWNQSVVNEKVYTLSLFSIGLVLWLAVRWGDEPAGARRDRWLVLIAYLLALTATNHLMGLLVAPAVLVYVLYTDPGVFGRWRMWVAVLTAAAIGVSVWLFLPIRSAHNPAINQGEPTTWDAFWAVLNREQYGKPPVTQRNADLLWQYANYLQYFTWQFAHDWEPAVRRVCAAGFGALGLLGAARHFRADRRGAVAMIALMATVTVALVFYLNFRYGYSIRPGESLDREVRERDYFFVASFHLWGVWVALGFGALLELGARVAATRVAGPARWYPAAPVLAVALLPLWGNRLTAPRAGETLPRDFALDLLQSVEPYGILVTTGDNDTFPLWYAQEVERVRRDVTLVNLSLGRTLWHIRQIQRRPQEPFDSAGAAAPYRGRAWPMPTEPVLSLSIEQINALPGIVPLDERRVFRAGTLRALLRGSTMDRATLVVLQLIADNLGERPIYFSRTVGGYATTLGLDPYLVGHGLARKLMPDSVRQTDTVVPIRAQGWVDVERSETLLFDVYHGASAARARPRGWVDPPSEGILTLYGVVYAGYAEWALRLADATDVGDGTPRVARARRAAELAEAILRQTSWFR